MKIYEIDKKDTNNARHVLNEMCKSVCTALRGRKREDYWTLFGKGLGEVSVNLNPYAKIEKSFITIYSSKEKSIRRIKNNLRKKGINIGNLVEERV